MAAKDNQVSMVNDHQLASVIRNRLEQVLIVDSRSFLEYNDFHIAGAINVCCSKLVKRRLQQEKVSVRDFLLHNCHIEVDESSDVIVYDQSSTSVASVALDSFLHVLLQKLVHVFRRVFLLSGGFLGFQACYRDLCEDKSRRCPALTSLSQPCLPTTNAGPTRILPFLYLGSQQDANNKELLSDYNIFYEVNVSTNCPKPDFIQESHFLRLPVNDSYGEKLLPYFVMATQFIDKVREANGYVLVHCLAGISRSPTVAIAYVMRHLKMTFDDAFRYVKSKRATISPNFNFLGQLLEYERQLRAEEVLDSSVGDISTAPVTRCNLMNSVSSPYQLGRERLSRSISLSLSLKSPLETVPSSPDHSLIDELDEPSIRQVDLSPTTALARLTFDAMDADQTEDTKESGRSFLVVSSQRKHTESYRSLRLREQRLSSSGVSGMSVGGVGSGASSESHFYSNKQTTESRSHMILTVSKRVSQAGCSLPRSRWKVPAPASAPASTPAAPATPAAPDQVACPSHCSEISVRIEDTTDPDPDSRFRLQRPRSDSYVRSRRRPSYAASEASSCVSDEFPSPASSGQMLRSCAPSRISGGPWGFEGVPPATGVPHDWSYARSDSVTTSGLGSEVSDSDTRADDAVSLCGSVRFGCPSEDSLATDDGVFTDTSITRPASPTNASSPTPSTGVIRRPRPRPSSLLGITPARDVDWKPMLNTDDSVIGGLLGRRSTCFSPLAAPTTPLRPPAVSNRLEEAACKDPDALFPSQQVHPDSATVFRLWRQREAAIEQERPESHAPLVVRRRSKDLRSSTGAYCEKRKSSETTEESQTVSIVDKRRTTRGDVAVQCTLVEDGLYRVKSCPGIVVEDPPNRIQLELELNSAGRDATRVRVRNPSRAVARQFQRYSCGTLDQKRSPSEAKCKCCGTVRHSSNPSLTCNCFSVIQVS